MDLFYSKLPAPKLSFFKIWQKVKKNSPKPIEGLQRAIIQSGRDTNAIYSYILEER
jgi:hypothetical protein